MMIPTQAQLAAARRAITLLGGPTETAVRLGLKGNRPLGTVWRWQVAGIPDRYCPAIERLTEGTVPCERLQPRLRWVRIADGSYPYHAAGKPLLDVDFAAA